jgi:hypothetical protein
LSEKTNILENPNALTTTLILLVSKDFVKKNNPQITKPRKVKKENIL